MDDLLTTKQVLELLKVDRITIYRMLQDGRLKGVKIGQQWRFPSREVERLLGREEPAVQSVEQSADPTFPVHCVQTIQDLFSDVSQIAALVLNMRGELLTQISHPNAFYQLLVSSPTGQEAYQTTWHKFIQQSGSGIKKFIDFAGMGYVGAPVYDRGEQVGLFLSGQFYWQLPDAREEEERMRRLAVELGISLEALQRAARTIAVISPDQHTRLENWPGTAARAIQSILRERISYIERLQQIANLTQIS